MDSIYDNLENYNDANVIQELTNENNSLKSKLEEYAASMSKLQNDFDKLEADFKKLELNYSTLLKTARAEIERKTQVITNLNMDKDMMVLSTIQNRNMLSLRTNMPKSRWERDSVSKKETNDHAKNTKELTDSSKSRSSSRGRKETSRTASEDTITSLNVEQTHKLKQLNVADKVSEKIEISKGRNKDIKENITQDYKEYKEERNLQSKSLSIKSRRKSMPSSRVYCKFSSDDEHEDSSSTVEANKKKLNRENSSRKNYDRGYNDKPDNRETGFNTFHNRWNKKYDSDRGRDSSGRYEYSQRNRRYLSPERTRRRSPRNRSDDRYPHVEYSRKRALDSPPHNKYNRHYNSNTDRDNNELDKHGSHPYDHERFAMKQNDPNDYDEPTTKRMRTNSIKLSEDDNRQHRQKSADHIPSMTEAVQIFEHISCQSPDYLLAESTIPPPIREIKFTAAYPLEDPRENSKRYVIKRENGTKVLSTIEGRNVDLRTVDTSVWGMDRMRVPDPLRKQPLQFTEDIVKEIYMDYDNPGSNLSLESGEILSYDQGASTNFADTNAQSNYESINTCEGSSPKEEFNSKIFETSSYRIPKIDKNNSTKTTTVVDKHKNKSKSKIEYKSSEVSNHDDICPENQIRMYKEKNKNITFPSITECQLKKPMSPTINSKEIVTECQLNNPVSPMATSRDMVERDLEFSDETCDNTDIEKRIVEEETVDPSTRKINKEMKSSVKENDGVCKIDGKDIKELSHTRDDQTNVKTSASNKKHKGKKKSQREKSVHKSENQETEMVSVTNENKEKVKLHKERNSRFPDLFGDSSSLITPEDLGLQQSQGHPVVQSPKYLQMFEDAQDGIDLAKKVGSTMKQEVKYSEKNSNISQSNTKSSKSSEHKKKKSKKIVVSTSTTLDVTENVAPSNQEIPNVKCVTTESDVVQTVIISTGVQPQPLTNVQSEHLLESGSTCNANIDVQISNTRKVDGFQTQHCVVLEPQETQLLALATSTPAKTHISLEPLTCYDTPEVGNNSSEVRVNVEQITPVVDQSSNSNTLDSHTEVDAPDVRIFIRRRRKGVKKTS